MTADFRRELDDHVYPRLNEHGSRLTATEAWIERAKGVITGIGLVAGIPALVLGWLALTGKLG